VVDGLISVKVDSNDYSGVHSTILTIKGYSTDYISKSFMITIESCCIGSNPAEVTVVAPIITNQYYYVKSAAEQMQINFVTLGLYCLEDEPLTLTLRVTTVSGAVITDPKFVTLSPDGLLVW
jgi:hypothetical protein